MSYKIIAKYIKDIKFEIKLYSYRNEPAIDVTVTEGELEVDPQKSCGGGVNDIISLVLKIIFIYLKGSTRILILDESLKFLSRNYLEQASSFISDISKRMNLQVILVSHKPELEVNCDNLSAFVDSINKRRKDKLDNHICLRLVVVKGITIKVGRLH